MTGASPTITRGTETLTGKELVIFLDEERPARPAGQPDYALLGSRREKRRTAPPKTEVTSDSSDLNYGGNKLVFQGNVKVRDPRMSLDCDRLEIFLTEKGGNGGGEKNRNPPESAMRSTSMVENPTRSSSAR